MTICCVVFSDNLVIIKCKSTMKNDTNLYVFKLKICQANEKFDPKTEISSCAYVPKLFKVET